MAVRGATVPNLLDVTRSLNPDGTQADIAEIMTQQNPLLQDMSWKEGNLVTGDRITVRNSLPSAAFRRLNQGVARSKSTARQVDEAAAMLEANSQVDRKLAILSGDINKYRLSEAGTFMEAMNQTMATTVFYGNSTVYDSQFTGLAPRFNSLTGPTGSQVIDAGGVGTDNRSIWLVVWAPDKVYGLYPKGTVGGLQHMDTTSNDRTGPDGHPIGDNILDELGRPYLGYTDHWEWNCGLGVKDPRYVIRIANIDYSLLSKDKSTGADLQDLMVQALERIQSLDGGNAVFYGPRAITSFLRRQLLNSKNAYLSWDEMAGKKVMSFGEVVVRRSDALNVDEARVT